MLCHSAWLSQCFELLLQWKMFQPAAQSCEPHSDTMWNEKGNSLSSWMPCVLSEGLISWGQLVCSANRNACTLFPALKTGCFSSKCMAILKQLSINPRQLMCCQPHLPTLAYAPELVQPHHCTMHTFEVLAYHTSARMY